MGNQGRVLLGLALIGVGVVFLLDQTGTLDAGDTIAMWWPAALVLFGLTQLVTDPRHVFVPALVAGIGGVLLLGTTGVVDADAWSLFWPVVLILVGFRLLVGRMGGDEEGPRASVFAAFYGSRVRVTSRAFKRGTVTSLFGGATLDLREAELQDGRGAVDVFVAFGGAEVIVPDHWRVRTSGLPLFGGWGNPSPSYALPADAPELSVYLLVAFGGAGIKRRPGARTPT